MQTPRAENEEDAFRFTVDVASLKEKKEEKLPSSEEDHGGEAAEHSVTGRRERTNGRKWQESPFL